jgi:hypothetical protein
VGVYWLAGTGAWRFCGAYGLIGTEPLWNDEAVGGGGIDVGG